MFVIGFAAGQAFRGESAPAQASASPAPPPPARPSAAPADQPATATSVVAVDPATPSNPDGSKTDKRKKKGTKNAAKDSTVARDKGAAGSPKAPEPQAAEGDDGEARDAKAFNTKAANRAMRSVVPAAVACRQPGDPSGEGQITLTFAPSGKVTNSSLSGGPYEGTQVGQCIASAFRSIRIPAFTGDPVTVSTTLTIE